MSNKKIEAEKEKIKKGKESCEAIVAFCNWAFTSIDSDPPKDAAVALEYNYDALNQPFYVNICSSYSEDITNITSETNESLQASNYCKLINYCERYACNNYYDQSSTKRLKKRAALIAEDTPSALEMINNDSLLGVLM